MTKLPIKTWQTLVPDPIVIPDMKQQEQRKPLEPVEQSQVKAVNDTTWVSMNEAGLKLLKKTIKEGEEEEGKGTEPLKTFHKEERLNIAKNIQEKKIEKKKKRASKPTTTTSTTAGSEVIITKKMKETVVLPAETMGPIKIVSIEEHNHRDDKLELFKAKMPMNKTSGGGLITAPPINKEQVLAYAELHRRKKELWFQHMNQRVANTEYTYPDNPEFSRKYLIQFLKAPKNNERPCINPEFGTIYGFKFRCIGHYLSEKQLGVGKGYRLREMIIEKDSIIPEMCYLCHLWYCLMQSIYQRDKQNEQTKRNLQDQYRDHIIILNRFKVEVDKPGEYDGNKMLLSDQIDSGIWGNFPLFNEENYVACKIDGCWGFKESDDLLFHPTQVASDRVVSIKQKDSTQSAHTLKQRVHSVSQN